MDIKKLVVFSVKLIFTVIMFIIMIMSVSMADYAVTTGNYLGLLVYIPYIAVYVWVMKKRFK